MIAVHALCSLDGGLRVWGETSALPARIRRPSGRPPRDPAPRPHPFAAGAVLLNETLATLSGSAETVMAGTAVLRLPSSELGPQPSTHLFRLVEDEAPTPEFSRLLPWQVDAVSLTPAAAAELLLSLPASTSAGVALGDSLIYLAEAAKLALELVARGRLRPVLQRDGTRWVARWQPVTDATVDAERIQILTRSMPAVLRAELSPWEDGPRPDLLVSAFLATSVDTCARALLAGQLAEVVAQTPGIDGVLAAWLRALGDEDPAVAGGERERAQLAEAVEEWWEAGQTYEARRMFRTCFRLVAPGGEELRDGGADAVDGVDPVDAAAVGDATVGDTDAAEGVDAVDDARTDTWRVEFMLQHKEDPSVLVPAAEVWARGERLSALGRMLENPQERLLGGLGHALALWPELATALERPAPSAVELSAEQAFAFLHDVVPLLEQAGFGVIAPPWWRQRPRAVLTATPEREWESSGLFGMEGLCAYEWQVAIGDVRLTLAELEALAELKLPLVRARGRWIALRSEDVELALRFFRHREAAGWASAADLVREGLGAPAAARAGQGQHAPEVEFEADGWLGELLADGRERRLEPVPTPVGFVGQLRPYQQRGLAWLTFMSRLGLGACLADDMGLGKTVQLIALLLAEREAAGNVGAKSPAAAASRLTGKVGPTLLVCPVSVAGNWRREAARFAPSLRVHVHYGRERVRGEALARLAADYDLVITTYALALRDKSTLASMQWERIVLDEAQHIKTRDAKQTRAIRALRARHRIALTGTPVENRLSELHSILDFLNPGLLGSATSFREQFATPIERWRDGAAAARLRRATTPFMLRRLKTDRDIIDDLPEKIEMRVDCHLTAEQATLYRSVVDEMLLQADLAEGIARAGAVLQALMKLKQVCNHPAHLLKDRSPLDGRSGKLAQLEEILLEALAEGDKALCFTQFAEFGRQLCTHLQDRLGREVLFLHGGTPKAARDHMVERFQAADGPAVFVLSLKAGGTGLNLTAANHVIHFDRWWNPAVEDQATDRAFRIGQRKNVQVRKLTCVGTLEERIDQLIAEKRDLADQIVGSGEAWLTELDSSQLRELVAFTGEEVAA
ncbi:MAG: SNF2-related protein [Solirubrobacteraceae bacterium]